MLEVKEIDLLETNIGKVHALHTEMAVLAKKASNDGVNTFKLRFINAVLEACNEQLTENFRPFSDFERFDEATLPTTSDVTFIAAQYAEAMERFRSEHIVKVYGMWYYDDGTEKPSRRTHPPKRFN